jgi:8-oxo-dGTP pyrophosphatase MutT (NUDIX family)
MLDQNEKQPKMPWQRIRFSYGPDLKLFRTRYDWMRNPRNDHEEKMIVLEGGDAVQIVAESEDEKILLVRQYRFGVGEYIYELPGGLIDAGETPALAAVRELREETAYTSDKWEYLGKHAANPVFMSAYVHHFTARKLTKAGAQMLDPGEDVVVEWLDRKEVKDRLLAGQFQHPHTVCALVAYFAAEWQG